MAYAQAISDDIAAWGYIRSAKEFFKQAKQYEQAASEGAGVALANAEAEAELFTSNSLRATMDAGAQRDLGLLAIRDAEKDARARQSTIESMNAWSGFDDSGSALDVLAEQAYHSARSINAISFESERKEKAFLAEAQDMRNASVAALTKGRDTSKAIIRQGQMQSYAAQAQGIAARTQAFARFVSMGTNIAGGVMAGGVGGGM